MSNYKVKVNNKAESKEVQGRISKLLDRSPDCFIVSVNQYPIYLGICDGDFCWGFNTLKDAKELTIPQLKDLVVLKRNSIDDATHTCGTKKYYLTPNDFYEYMGDKWVNVDEYVDGCIFDPIIKPLKEYLDPKMNYELCLSSEDLTKEGMIKVPEGSMFYAEDSNMGVKDKYFFRLRDENFDDDAMWVGNRWMRACFDVRNMGVMWQRHTQPEELLFVDDEPKSLNNTYAEIKQVRQDSVNNPQHYNKGGIECIDAIEASMTPEAFKGYLKGNVQKYMWRYEHKGGKESLQKAQWYLNKLISKL